MRTQDVRKELEAAFPQIRFDDGPKLHDDSKGMPYRTYTLGRHKPADTEGVLVIGLSEKELAYLAYLYLRSVIEAVRPMYIEWRLDPTIAVDETEFRAWNFDAAPAGSAIDPVRTVYDRPVTALRFITRFSMRFR